jgi:hypothetical protein
VGLSYIQHVNIIADPAAIGRVVVVTVHFKVFAPPYRDLHHVRKDVAGRTPRVLTQSSAREDLETIRRSATEQLHREGPADAWR